MSILNYKVWHVFAILGALCVAVFMIIMVLGLFTYAFAQEATPVRKATLSESHQSYNYPLTADTGVHYYMASGVVRDDYVSARRCEAYNDGLRAKIAMLAEHMVQNPKQAHIYVQALTTMQSLWCTDDN